MALSFPARAESWVVVSDVSGGDDAMRAAVDSAWDQVARAKVDELGHSIASNLSFAENSAYLSRLLGPIRGRCGEACLSELGENGDGTLVSRLIASRDWFGNWRARVEFQRPTSTRLLAEVAEELGADLPSSTTLGALLARAIKELPDLQEQVPVDVVVMVPRVQLGSVRQPTAVRGHLFASAQQDGVIDRCWPSQDASIRGRCTLWLRPGPARFEAQWMGAVAAAGATLEVQPDGGRLYVSPGDLASPVLAPTMIGCLGISIPLMMSMPSAPIGIAFWGASIAFGLQQWGTALSSILRPPKLLDVHPFEGADLESARARRSRGRPFEGSAGLQRVASVGTLHPRQSTQAPTGVDALERSLHFELSDARMQLALNIGGERLPCEATSNRPGWCTIEGVPSGVGSLELRGMGVPADEALVMTGPSRSYRVEFDPYAAVGFWFASALAVAGAGAIVVSVVDSRGTLGPTPGEIAPVAMLLGTFAAIFNFPRIDAPDRWSVLPLPAEDEATRGVSSTPSPIATQPVLSPTE